MTLSRVRGWGTIGFMEKTYLYSSADVLELAALAEAGVRNFYRACANQWPEEGEFWLGLATEEDGHYNMVNRMLELVKAAPDRYPLRGPFAAGAYRSFIDWVLSMTAGATNGALANKEAVEISNTIEATILESQLQDLVRTTEPEYLRLIGQIIEQTRRHAIMVTARAKGLIKTGASR